MSSVLSAEKSAEAKKGMNCWEVGDPLLNRWTKYHIFIEPQKFRIYQRP